MTVTILWFWFLKQIKGNYSWEHRQLITAMCLYYELNVPNRWSTARSTPRSMATSTRASFIRHTPLSSARAAKTLVSTKVVLSSSSTGAEMTSTAASSSTSATALKTCTPVLEEGTAVSRPRPVLPLWSSRSCCPKQGSFTLRQPELPNLSTWRTWSGLAFGVPDRHSKVSKTSLVLLKRGELMKLILNQYVVNVGLGSSSCLTARFWSIIWGYLIRKQISYS